MSITATQICEQFELLNDEERIEVFNSLRKRLPEHGDELDELLALAESRSAEMTSGRVQGTSWAEVQKQLDDEEVDLAEKRDAELAAGTKKLISEDEFRARMERFKATLR
ncbi:hypothetical protein [Brevifollis gellanilyticus]|uniref:Uncharacterized protein n=1 Tax=Brevifollis gellanilyticus TaxID=748831 RepID=A0A512MBE1_9BACT|nr:hypothetical protein [Brevifollis gellanilyticus]GEP44049.1 hypothetical protein BGE01nite_33400 [Brevifollis gellanilyticus]